MSINCPLLLCGEVEKLEEIMGPVYEEKLSDYERLLIVNLVTEKWAKIVNDPEFIQQIHELSGIIRKLSGADKTVVVRRIA